MLQWRYGTGAEGLRGRNGNRRKPSHVSKPANRFRRCALVAMLCATQTVGCLHTDHDPPLSYVGEGDNRFYQHSSTEIAYPAIETPEPPEVVTSLPPHTIRDQQRTGVWDLPLAEALHIALQNSEIIRRDGQFLAPNAGLLGGGDQVPSVLDPAIQETGVLFGSRSVAAALASFDANFTSSLIWGRDEQLVNNFFFSGGTTTGQTLTRETAAFRSSLAKTFAYGGQVSLNHNVDYQWSNSGGQLFPSVYTGSASVGYRQPLLAGSGVEYTRIAGPISQNFGGISGVSQGVVIARINQDITLADFEANIRGLLKDVEDAYWDLYLNYRIFDAVVEARNSALASWRIAKTTRELGGAILPADEAQARDQYFAGVAGAQTARSNIYAAETRLRRLMGLPVNDGRVLRPVDTPTTAEFIPDWQASLVQALTERLELRKQKWNIKSLQLQLTAARSLTQPRLDLVGDYRVNGFGDDLLRYDDDDSVGTRQGLNSFYETLTQGDQTGWTLGVELNVPVGFRLAHAQVRNLEFRLAKAQKVLSAQELDVSHELATAFQELARTYENAQTIYSRREAAIENVNLLEPFFAEGEITIDLLLRAQSRRADAERAFYESVTAYNKALAEFHFRKGTLLSYNNVVLEEGPWVGEALQDAIERAQRRAHSIPADHLETVPPDFASHSPVDSVVLTGATIPETEPIDDDPVLLPVPEPVPPSIRSNDDLNEPPAVPPATDDDRPPLPETTQRAGAISSPSRPQQPSLVPPAKLPSDAGFDLSDPAVILPASDEAMPDLQLLPLPTQ